MVERQADVLDVSSLACLFNTTPNLSVQSIILQALSGLPLSSVPFIGRSGPEGISVVKAINEHFHPDQPVDRFERFERAALRFETQDPQAALSTSCQEPSYYASCCRDPVAAIKLIKENLIDNVRRQTCLDALLWGKIFATSLSLGTWWLEIDHDTPSRLWSELLRCIVKSLHDCNRVDCDGKKQRLVTFPLQGSMPSLVVDSYEPRSKGCHFGSALSEHMFPSVLQWVKHVGFRTAVRSPEAHTHNLPDDMFLLLCMIQTPSIQRTSSLHRTWVADDAFLLEKLPSLFRHLLNTVCEYTIVPRTPLRHRSVDLAMATIKALQNVMRSDAFGTGSIITSEDESIVVLTVFKGLNSHLHQVGTQGHNFSWLSEEVGRKVLHVAFQGPDNTVKIFSNVLSYLLRSNSVDGSHSAAIECVYSGLLGRSWLNGLSTTIEFGWAWSARKHPDVHPLHLWAIRDTGYLAASYIDGLAVLEPHDPDVYKRALEDLSRPTNLSTICKALLLSDVNQQSKLWKLAKLVHGDHWLRCLDDLISFSLSPQAIDMYSSHYHTIHVGLGGRMVRNVPSYSLHTIAATLKWDIEGCQGAPPPLNYIPWPNEFEDARADFKANSQ
ncbi:hypothetical protein BDZ89DRAFT_1102944 [Hymenopellis radicata]|nr:hypothetical protein BDZ89DRAFT_1102944 [Hymenopellis radicata]